MTLMNNIYSCVKSRASEQAKQYNTNNKLAAYTSRCIRLKCLLTFIFILNIDNKLNYKWIVNECDTNCLFTM